MIHLGDITKIHGCAVPITDVVIGGSPCQDLSVAGKRAGLSGARSGLFMEQIRIVKEMRYADKCGGRTGQFIRPRYMVWENVPGAFSSNGGEDFRAVLEEICRVADEASNVPGPKTGKWYTSGAILGKGWSVAWRILDAQFWGVPQRRRRIALVADFGGRTAPEILFERNGLCWNPPKGGETGQGTAGDSAGGTGETERDNCLTPWDVQSRRIFEVSGKWPALYGGEGGGHGYACYPQVSDMLTRRNDGSPNPDKHQGLNIVCIATQQGGAECRIDDKAPTLTAAAGMSGNNQPVCCYGFKLGNSEQARSIGFQEERSPTLNAECGGNKPAICFDMTHATDVIRECGETAPTLQSRMGTGGNQIPLTFQNTGRGWWNQSDCAGTIRTPCGGDSTKANLALTYQKVTGPLMANIHPGSYTGQDAYTDMFVCGVDCRNGNESEVNGTLQAKPSGGQSLNLNNVVRTGYAVRRLTPLECERLQGYPDGWTDIGAWTDTAGKLHKESSDSARYKALGNSIALPPWKWVLKRLCALYERDATMASLFDGIGGFPLIWEQLNGKGSCLWASEIEDFPIAVTKRQFGKTG